MSEGLMIQFHKSRTGFGALAGRKKENSPVALDCFYAHKAGLSCSLPATIYKGLPLLVSH
jgi:hypothetical protein